MTVKLQSVLVNMLIKSVFKH